MCGNSEVRVSADSKGAGKSRMSSGIGPKIGASALRFTAVKPPPIKMNSINIATV